MKITPQSIVGDIVARNYKTADIFRGNRIDFFCEGQQTLEEAYQRRNGTLSGIQSLVQELHDFFMENDTEEVDFRTWPLDRLVDHIETKHHAYVERRIPLIKEHLNLIITEHGKEHPELVTIHDIFKEASGQLAMHMKKEELILFPYIRKMAAALREQQPLVPPPFGTIKNPIAKMEGEHDFEGEAFERIAVLSRNYSAPEDADIPYKTAYAMLKEFAGDLQLHIHKENNILFQRALALEEELLYKK